MLDPLGGL